jgi:methyl-accepting chemotaxis protein
MKNTMSQELQKFLAPTDGDNAVPEDVMAHGIWAPGVRLMRNLQFGMKAALIVAIFMAPIAWLTFAYFSNNNTQLEFSSKERLGVQYGRSIFAVIDLAQQLRRDATAAAGGAAPATLDDVKARLKSAQDKLAATEKLLGKELQTGKAYAALQKSFADTDRAKSAQEVFQAHSDHIAALVGLLTQATDASNLTLDPDIDSYYLMDAALFRLPDILESTGKLRGLGLAVMRAGEATPAQLALLNDVIPIANFQFSNIQQGLDKAGAYNPGITSQVNAKATLEATASFFAAARQTLFVGKDFSKEAQAAYLASANQAIEAQYQLVGRILDQLDTLLLVRIDAMKLERTKTLVILGVSLLLALYLFYSFFLVTRGGLLLISKHLQEMAEGDLRSRPQKPWGTDEPAAVIIDLRKAYDSLHILIRKVRHSARALHAASGEIAAASTDLGARTESAASALEEQASAMEEIGSTVSATAERASMAATFAVDNAHVAQRGGAVFAEVVTTMKEIHSSSSKINDIISVIDGIAFQTNILALNAAVEAARAGETGRGFAVVASEVRMLAQRSAAAAKEIKGLISASVDRVENGMRIVEGAGSTMGEVVTNATQINQFLSEISTAAREQAIGVAEVGRAVQDLDRNTSQNAALVEQTNAAAGALTAQADVLQAEIANFRVA